ncbi:hypothetical protein C8J56DRAFT_1031376 [Mycena floridula]|nr:hypothetical protein C8J56DRAFT_1031376 [Mycena floridula]
MPEETRGLSSLQNKARTNAGAAYIFGEFCHRHPPHVKKLERVFSRLEEGEGNSPPIIWIMDIGPVELVHILTCTVSFLGGTWNGGKLSSAGGQPGERKCACIYFTVVTEEIALQSIQQGHQLTREWLGGDVVCRDVVCIDVEGTPWSNAGPAEAEILTVGCRDVMPVLLRWRRRVDGGWDAETTDT